MIRSTGRWFRAALPPAEEAAVVAALPVGHHIVGHTRIVGPKHRRMSVYTAVLVGPQGEVSRAASGLPFVACLRAMGIES